MKINIDKFTGAELIDLNYRIVARLRLLNEMRALSEMLEPGQGQVGDGCEHELVPAAVAS
jgi:hypothetical protein